MSLRAGKKTEVAIVFCATLLLMIVRALLIVALVFLVFVLLRRGRK
jgi:hypothetical protein